jgi:carbon starvation protein
MLAGIALCLVTTIILKMRLLGQEPAATKPKPLLRVAAPCLITVLPLCWLLSATMTAGVQKIWHPDPRIGFLAQASVLQVRSAELTNALADARKGTDVEAVAGLEKSLRRNAALRFNNLLDAAVAGVFMVMMAAIFFLSVREWFLLLTRLKIARLRESDPTWLPDYASSETRSLRVASLLAVALALAKELSGQAGMERAQQAATACDCAHPDIGLKRADARDNEPIARERVAAVYVEETKRRFEGVRRCC